MDLEEWREKRAAGKHEPKKGNLEDSIEVIRKFFDIKREHSKKHQWIGVWLRIHTKWTGLKIWLEWMTTGQYDAYKLNGSKLTKLTDRDLVGDNTISALFVPKGTTDEEFKAVFWRYM